MGTLTAVFLFATWATGEWGFLVLGLVGLAAGLVPFFSRR